MAEATATSIDNLNIVISADASKASRSIGTLTKRLTDLSAIAVPVRMRLNSIAKALKNITNESSGAAKKVLETATKFKDVAMDAGGNPVKEYAQERVKTEQSVSNTIKSVLKQREKEAEAHMKRVNSLLAKIKKYDTLGKDKTSESYRSLIYDFNEATKGTSMPLAIPEKEEKAAKQTAKLAKEHKNLAAATKESATGFRKLLASVGRIAFYRAIRTALKAITSAVKEGLTNLYTYSQEVGTAFAPAVDNLRKHVLMLKNSFATALRPVLESLIPVVIQIVDWFSKLADMIAQVFSIITGNVDENGRYTKAVLGDLEASNEEAKELKRTLLGFDEINRLEGDNGNNKQASAAITQFVQADISERAKKIADMLNGIDWELIGTVLGAWAALNTAKFLGWKGILGTFVAVSAFFGDDIADAIDKAQKKIDDFYDNLGSTGTSTGDSLIRTSRSILQNGLTAVSSLSKAIYALAHGDAKGAQIALIDTAAAIAKGVIDLGAGAINLVLGVFNDAVNAIALGVRWVHNNVIAPIGDFFVRLWKNMGIELHNAWLELQQGLLIACKWIVERINDLLRVVEVAIMGAIDIINFLFGTNLKTVNLQIDTTTFDKEIEHLENMELPYIDQTVEFVPRWEKDPEKLNIQVDTSGAKAAIDDLANRAKQAVMAIANVGESVTRSENAAKRANSSKVSITHYASGGYPDAGSLFLAGERGASPEIVGTFGGRTGVMNSEQLSAALYNAFTAALAANPQGGDIYLDGEVIYRNTVRRNNNAVRSTGRSALLT